MIHAFYQFAWTQTYGCRPSNRHASIPALSPSIAPERAVFRRRGGLVLATLAALVLNAFPLTALADPIEAGDLEITRAWTRATPPAAKAGGGYVTIRNIGATPDRLLGARSPSVGRIEIHEMKMADGVMSMAPVEGGLEIAAGETVTLKPGGYHLMMIGLNNTLKEGDILPVTLRFETAGDVDLPLAILRLGAKSMEDGMRKVGE